MDAPPAAPSDPTPAKPFRTPANRFGTTNLGSGPQTFVQDHKPSLGGSAIAQAAE